MRGKEGAGHAIPRRYLKLDSDVSVPLRGKEGAGLQAACKAAGVSAKGVSVPLRGKEGAGPARRCYVTLTGISVSVPLRGKEGAGPTRTR